MTAFEVAVIVSGVVTVIVVAALIVVNLKLAERIKILMADCVALEQKFVALRGNYQNELLAIGQRVLEADKIVRHFSERLDAIENDRAVAEPQYGQLQSLLKQAGSSDGDASAAEVELLSLLTRNRKATS